MNSVIELSPNNNAVNYVSWSLANPPNTS